MSCMAIVVWPQRRRGAFICCLPQSLDYCQMTIDHASLSGRQGEGVCSIGEMYSISCMAVVV